MPASIGRYRLVNAQATSAGFDATASDRGSGADAAAAITVRLTQPGRGSALVAAPGLAYSLPCRLCRGPAAGPADFVASAGDSGIILTLTALPLDGGRAVPQMLVERRLSSAAPRPMRASRRRTRRLPPNLPHSPAPASMPRWAA